MEGAAFNRPLVQRDPAKHRTIEIVNADLEIIDYAPEHQPWFEHLNRHWIEKYFSMEPLDYLILQDPEEHILKPGGSILMALYGKEIAGTVALKRIDTALFELTKMAVEEKFQGMKIGRALCEAAISKARSAGAKRIFLYSSTLLTPAIQLYLKLGFREVPVDGPYKRSDIKMELELSGVAP